MTFAHVLGLGISLWLLPSCARARAKDDFNVPAGLAQARTSTAKSQVEEQSRWRNDRLFADPSREVNVWLFNGSGGAPGAMSEVDFDREARRSFDRSSWPNKRSVHVQDVDGVSRAILDIYKERRLIHRLIFYGHGNSGYFHFLTKRDLFAMNALSHAFGPEAVVFFASCSVGVGASGVEFMEDVARTFLSARGGWVVAALGPWREGTGKSYRKCHIDAQGKITWPSNPLDFSREFERLTRSKKDLEQRLQGRSVPADPDKRELYQRLSDDLHHCQSNLDVAKKQLMGKPASPLRALAAAGNYLMSARDFYETIFKEEVASD